MPKISRVIRIQNRDIFGTPFILTLFDFGVGLKPENLFNWDETFMFSNY